MTKDEADAIAREVLGPAYSHIDTWPRDGYRVVLTQHADWQFPLAKMMELGERMGTEKVSLHNEDGGPGGDLTPADPPELSFFVLEALDQ